ncbi:Crp/Fnr family transcriptional regulator [Cupriavidus consociatus]|uniref:Crp/Fnr family transcriptional regulator n=1 Tax=Cupriavidus consociatus TaxID=2821357 RepID=UPI001AE23218|nr:MULTISPECIES: Crp/Fnr family transcriptional regulator [unclassified Cupriavidus]MBP0623298.1 Crp/Fnr family transcriptional regulator [Cupriavidus sp. LEh25]MDK2659994.1 Crp/Fnr family transcriptional regulator [Cupriavidus sp. LEh21]
MGSAPPPHRHTRLPASAAQARGRPDGSLPDNDPLAAVRAGAWFSQLPPALRQALLDDGCLRRLVPGETLFARGDRFDGLYCVASGTVQIHASGESGKAALLGLLEPGTWFGEICLFDGLPRTHDARAVSAAALWHLPRAPLERRLAQHPAWWQAFGRLLATKTRQAFDYVEETQLLPPAARIARRLAAIAHGYGNLPVHADAVLRVRIPQEQLAQMLGLSRQTVNHALRELETRGLLRLEYGGIELLDLAALEALN